MGEELTQAYADATADLVYKYAFAPDPTDPARAGGVGSVQDPLEGDVVSISLDLVASVVTSSAATTSTIAADATATTSAGPVVGAFAFAGTASDAAADPSHAAKALVEEREAALCATGASAPSPWDGLEEHVTVELSGEGQGGAKLIGVALGLGRTMGIRASAGIRATATAALWPAARLSLRSLC